MRITVAPKGGDFTSLGEAIAHAPPDANILVVPGTYVESNMPIVISKSLSISLASPTAQCRGNGCSAIIVPYVNTKAPAGEALVATLMRSSSRRITKSSSLASSNDLQGFITTVCEPEGSSVVTESEFPLELPIGVFQFKLKDRQHAPVGHPLQETWVLTNKTDLHYRMMFISDSNDKFDLQFKPESRKMKPGQKAAVTVTLILKCTTELRRNIPVIVEGSQVPRQHVYIPLRIGSQITTKLDFDEITMGDNPICEDELAGTYPGTWRSSKVQVKLLKIQNPDEIALRDFMRTVELMDQLSCSSLIKFLGASSSPGKICIVFEHAACGSLESVIAHKVVPEAFKKRVVTDIAHGMDFLHKHGVVHHKLSPVTVLITSLDHESSTVAKLSEFGFPRRGPDEPDGYSVEANTIYTAPELFRDRAPFEYPADVYRHLMSFAMVLYFLFKGEHPFCDPHFASAKDIESFLEEGKRLPLDFPCPPLLKNLITECWAEDPLSRPDFPAIVKELDPERGCVRYSASELSAPPDNRLLVVKNCKVEIKGIEFRGPVHVNNSGSLSMEQCCLPSVAATGRGTHMSLLQCTVDPTKYGVNAQSSSVKFSEYAAGTLDLSNVSACSISGTGIEVSGFAEPTIRACSIRYGQVGVSFWKNGNGVIENCCISDTGLAGIEVARASAPTIRGCSICSSRGFGITLHDSGKGTITSCNIYSNMREGVDVHRTSQAVLVSSYVHHNAKTGVHLIGSKCEITGCHIFSNELAGVRTSHSKLNMCQCWIQGNKLPGLVILRDSKAHVTNCCFRAGEQSGIFFCNGGHGSVEKCTISSNSLAGVEISTDSDPDIRHCIIDSNKYGVHYRDRGLGHLENCTIIRNSSSNIRVFDESEPFIRACRVFESGGVGIRFSNCGSGAILENCDIAASNASNVEIIGNCSPTIRSCQIHDGNETGLRFDKEASGMVELCTIFRNCLEGISVRNLAYPLIRKCLIVEGLQSGIVLHSCGSSTLIDNCEIHSNTTSGIELSKNSAPIIRGCNIHECLFAGVQYLDESGGSLLECKISNNGTPMRPQPGIEVPSMGGPIIKNCVIDGSAISTKSTQETPRPNLRIAQVIFTPGEIAASTDNYNESRKLGEGAHGIVFRGVLHGTPVAVKVMDSKLRSSVKKGFEYEVQLLSTFRHRNLVPLLGCCSGEPLALVYDLMEGGALKPLLKQARRSFAKDQSDLLPWKQRLNIAIGCARGLLFLHATTKPPVIHRDFKSANVLLDRHREPRIGDFGLARLLPENTQTGNSAGTPGYICPEYDAHGTLTTKVDVYSFGVVLMELLTGMPALLYDKDDNGDVIEDSEMPLPEWVAYNIARGMKRTPENPLSAILQPNWPVDIAVSLYNVARQCLVSEQDKRVSMADVLATLEVIELTATEYVGATNESETGE